MKKSKISTAVSLCIFMGSSVSLSVQAEDKVEKLGTVTVDGSAEEGNVSSVGRELQDFPGAATVVSAEKIKEMRPLSAVNVMKTVPGVYAHDEYGRGLRPNIGIRGMNPSRSKSGTLLMSDGVPIQPAIYGAKSAYYGIPIENVERIEVVKGGSSVLLGPGNIGGTVNYITTNPPKEKTFKAKGTVHQGGLLQTYLSAGDTNDSGQGYLLSFSNKVGSTARENTDMNASDLSLKLTTPISSGGDFWVRMNYYNESANTPGEITPAEFEENPMMSTRTNDVFRGQRMSTDLHLNVPINKDVDFESVGYLSFYERNWQIGKKPDAINTKNGHFERAFINLGVEPRIKVRNLAGGNWVFGTRFHYEGRDEVKMDGNSPTARVGVATGVSSSSSKAVSPYFEGEYEFGNLTVIGGLRQEIISQQVDNAGLYKSDGTVKSAPFRGTKLTSVTLGALGTTYKLNDNLNVYGGINRAMQPLSFRFTADPQYDNPSEDLDVEIGTTIEAGLRGILSRNVSVDAGVFSIAYDNKVIRDGHSTRNGGKASYTGLEAGIIMDATESLRFDANYTYVDAKQESGVHKGNKLPMAPENILAWGASYDLSNDLSLRLEGLYTGERYSDGANTEVEDVAGKVGKLDAHHVMNIRGNYRANKMIEVFAGVNNITDEEVKQRRKRGGISPGLPLSAYVGVEATF